MKNTPILLPKNIKILKELGEQIQLARLRRKFSADQIAERTGMGRKTVYNIEQGSPSVSIGSYLQVLFVGKPVQKLKMRTSANLRLFRKQMSIGRHHEPLNPEPSFPLDHLL